MDLPITIVVPSDIGGVTDSITVGLVLHYGQVRWNAKKMAVLVNGNLAALENKVKPGSIVEIVLKKNLLIPLHQILQKRLKKPR